MANSKAGAVLSPAEDSVWSREKTFMKPGNGNGAGHPPSADGLDSLPMFQQGQTEDEKIFIKKVMLDLRTFREATGKGLAEIGRATALAASTISQFETGQYAAKGTQIAHKIAAYLALEARRLAAPSDPTWIQTENSRKILTVMAQCQELRDLGMIYGAAGLGKTRTAEYFHAENPSSILITCTQAIRHPSAFLRHLAQLEDVKGPVSGAMDALFEGVLQRLRNSGRLLIVDEAQMLEFKTLELIRSLHDLGKIGVVLMGDEMIWNLLFAGRTRAQYERLASRVGIRRCLQAGVPKADVARFAAQYLGHQDPECVAYLVKKAQGVGGIRTIVKHCRLAFRLAQGDGGRQVTVQDLEEASELLG